MRHKVKLLLTRECLRTKQHNIESVEQPLQQLGHLNL
jgi:hypothetical protein